MNGIVISTSATHTLHSRLPSQALFLSYLFLNPNPTDSISLVASTWPQVNPLVELNVYISISYVIFVALCLVS